MHEVVGVEKHAVDSFVVTHRLPQPRGSLAALSCLVPPSRFRPLRLGERDAEGAHAVCHLAQLGLVVTRTITDAAGSEARSDRIVGRRLFSTCCQSEEALFGLRAIAKPNAGNTRE